MSETPPPAIVIIGVGNELYRDEGVGVVVARRLAEEGLPDGVMVIEGAVGGLNLLFEMENAQRVILVDAVELGAEPGTVRVFQPEEVTMVGAPLIASLHQVALSDVLQLGELVGIAPETYVVGVQPGEVAPGFTLTDAVEAAVPLAMAEVRRLVGEFEE